jgi:hypothetical protein
VVPTVEAFYAGIAGLVAAVSGLFGGDWKNVTDSLKEAFRTLSSYAIQAAAYILRFTDSLLGTNLARDFAKGARQALLPEESRDTPQKAAPRNAGVGGLAECGRQVTEAALTAGLLGTGRTKEDDERAWRESVVKNLEAIARGDESQLGKALTDLGGKIIAKLDNLVEEVKRPVYEGSAGFAKGAIAASGLNGPLSVLNSLLGR